MALVTLSGVISAADLNNNFAEGLSSLLTGNSGKVYQYEIKTGSLAVSTNLGKRSIDFIAPDDCRISKLMVSFFNPDATSRTAVLKLEAINEDGTPIGKYTTDTDISVSATTAAVGEVVNILIMAKWDVFRGVLYRLSITRTDANAGVITSANGYITLNQLRRFK
jgi:hypothetical protein